MMVSCRRTPYVHPEQVDLHLARQTRDELALLRKLAVVKVVVELVLRLAPLKLTSGSFSIGDQRHVQLQPVARGETRSPILDSKAATA